MCDINEAIKVDEDESPDDRKSPVVTESDKVLVPKLPVPMSFFAVPPNSPAVQRLRPTPNLGLFPQQQEQHSGSATGNPRNKCALKPGHSLMDWIRLGSSGIDLAGTKGAIIKVSHQELAKHNKQNDAWIAIHGKVFNVTRYMDFHPGGVEELMKGVGKDATKIFDDVHAWVNYEQLLGKCFVGPLRNTGLITINEDMPKMSRLSPNLNERFKLPSFKLSNSSPDVSIAKSPERVVEVIPRFDWIQKTSDLTIIFYTKSLCNPGLVIDYQSPTECDIRVFLEKTIHLCHFKFSHNTQWPCSVRIVYETGKIEIVFAKEKPSLWTNFGTLERKKVTELEDFTRDFDVYSRDLISDDSYALVLKPKTPVHFVVPLGYHFSVTARIHCVEVTRSYTPVPSHYVSNECPFSSIPLLVKSYSSGILSKHLTRSPPLANSLMLSQPKGYFSLHKLKNHCRVGLVCAGSGVTPMLAILDYLVERTSNKLENIQLLFFNKKESDIWCRQKLDSLPSKDARVKVRHILSEPSDKWEGESGRISNKIATSLCQSTSSDYVTFCCICGPTPFNDLTLQVLKENGFDSSTLYCFQG